MVKPTAKYRLHGLIVESALMLDAEPADGEADWSVSLGPVRKVTGRPPGVALAELDLPGFAYWLCEEPCHSSVWTLRYAGICDFVVNRGERTIEARPFPGVTPEFLGIILAGSVLAHLLSADGHLVLHASAVELVGEALALVGASGAGKSTLAAVLCGGGATLVSDDTLQVDPQADGAVCYPGTSSLRLRAAGAPLADGIVGADVSETVDGRMRVRGQLSPSDGFRLRAILVPRPSRETTELAVERLGTREALVELLRYPRVIGWRAEAPLRSHFEGAAALAESVPVHCATVPWGPPFAPGLAAELLDACGLAELRAGAHQGPG